jgi:ferredoxin-NADP reductase
MRFETKVKDVIVRAHNVKSFRFDRPASFDYRAGQFMFVTIMGGGEKMDKHFSISSSPTEEDHIEFTKKLTGSPFSNALDALRVGDWAEVDAPYGDFTYDGEYGKLAMLTGGIGITPLRSICRYCTDMGSAAEIALLYGCRTEGDLVFRDEFEEMRLRNKNLKVVFFLEEPGEGWAGRRGMISAEAIRDEIPDFMERAFYICGPPAMVEAMAKVLRDLSVPEGQIKEEGFPGY